MIHKLQVKKHEKKSIIKCRRRNSLRQSAQNLPKLFRYYDKVAKNYQQHKIVNKEKIIFKKKSFINPYFVLYIF